jgi:hypothetical protein
MWSGNFLSLHAPNRVLNPVYKFPSNRRSYSRWLLFLAESLQLHRKSFCVTNCVCKLQQNFFIYCVACTINRLISYLWTSMCAATIFIVCNSVYFTTPYHSLMFYIAQNEQERNRAICELSLYSKCLLLFFTLCQPRSHRKPQNTTTSLQITMVIIKWHLCL